MVIDASVWVALFREGGAHYEESVSFLAVALKRGVELHIPNLALAEIAGVFSRETRSAKLALRTVRAVLKVPLLQRHGFDDNLADHAYALAVRHRLRGADAVYVALAEHVAMPLLTWDREIIRRVSPHAVRILTPGAWLHTR